MSVPPRTPWHGQLALSQLLLINQWHKSYADAHPVECQVWDAVLTVWVMGWIAWLPALIFDTVWVYPLCLLGLMAPKMYVRLRGTAQRCGALRCEWLKFLD